MAVGFNNSATTDYVAAGGLTAGARSLARPTDATTNDLVWLIRHHSATTVPAFTGASDGDLTANTIIPVGSTSQIGQYRRMTSPTDQSGGWSWTSSGTSAGWLHAAIRFTGASTSGSAFTPGTAAGTATSAGEWLFNSSAATHTLTVGNANAGDMGVVVLVHRNVLSSVSSGWSFQVMADNGGSAGSSLRYVSIVWKSYSSAATADTVTLTFASASNQIAGRLGVIAQADPNATTTPAAGASTLTATNPGVQASTPNASATPAPAVLARLGVNPTATGGSGVLPTPASAVSALVGAGVGVAWDRTVTPASGALISTAPTPAINTVVVAPSSAVLALVVPAPTAYAYDVLGVRSAQLLARRWAARLERRSS